jgi:hypothetical protein
MHSRSLFVVGTDRPDCPRGAKESPLEADAYATGKLVTKGFLDRAKAPATTP